MGDVKDGGHLTECLLIRTVIVGNLLVVLNQLLRSLMGSCVLATNLLQVSLVDNTSGLHILLVSLVPIHIGHTPIIEVVKQYWAIAYRPLHKAVKRIPGLQIHLVNSSHITNTFYNYQNASYQQHVHPRTEDIRDHHTQSHGCDWQHVR